MTAELIVQCKADGSTWQLFPTTACWSTQRNGSPGKFTFSFLQCGVRLAEGDVVRFTVDGQLQFYGWIFTQEGDHHGKLDVTCYDRLRYLKANASYAFYSQPSEEIVRQVAADFQLEVSRLDATGYSLPSLIEQDKSCLDILTDAIQQTLLHTGRVFVLYDDGSGLCLREAKNMTSDRIAGDGSLMLEYTYTTDIDKQSYNSVKLVRPNEETGRAEVFLAQDSEHIGQWGLLQLYQTVDSAENDAQCRAKAAAMLDYYNAVRRTFRFRALGVPGLRAGQMMPVVLSGLRGEPFSRYVLLDRVSHTFENDLHTMEVECTAM